MKILIDTRIVKIYSNLPDVFKLRELLTQANIPLSEEKTIYDSLKRMEELGILHKTESNRKWHKEDDTLKEWFEKYLIKIENDTLL
jgi:Fe2+ or Zn2+ uptake regulation protein